MSDTPDGPDLVPATAEEPGPLAWLHRTVGLAELHDAINGHRAEEGADRVEAQ